jgi:hypothetical protein
MPSVGKEELRGKEAALKAKIERLLPGFIKSCRGNEDVVLLHQDSFAADYQARRIRAPRDGDKICRALRKRSPHYRNKQTNGERCG